MKGNNINKYSKGDTITRVALGVDISHVYNDSTYQTEIKKTPAYQNLMGIKCEYVGIYNNQIVVVNQEGNSLERLPFENFEDGWAVYEEIPNADKYNNPKGNFHPFMRQSGNKVEFNIPIPVPVRESIEEQQQTLKNSFRRRLRFRIVYDLLMWMSFLIFVTAVVYEINKIGLIMLGVLIVQAYCGLAYEKNLRSMYNKISEQAHKIVGPIRHFKKAEDNESDD